MINKPISMAHVKRYSLSDEFSGATLNT